MVDLKSVVKAMCKAYPGGRSAMAGALGMTETQFNNNLYEKNGCRFFEIAELEAMEDISSTNHLADYFAQRRGGFFVEIPNRDELDHVDLFIKGVKVAAKSGKVDQQINTSIADDGVIDPNEKAEIMALHFKHLSARDEYVKSVVALHERVDASGVQSRGVGALKTCVE
ncbi:hypothetical protein EJP81_23070 (plasmid) [Rahnella aquatilis]|nr:hypothetical protein EJP79_23070 [Rahnella aquatilis]QEU51560.1 hypothetical protein EJP81_23070 [Rahnella aquatilis]